MRRYLPLKNERVSLALSKKKKRSVLKMLKTKCFKNAVVIDDVLNRPRKNQVLKVLTTTVGLQLQKKNARGEGYASMARRSELQKGDENGHSARSNTLCGMCLRRKLQLKLKKSYF
jgi:hypothetical protein